MAVIPHGQTLLAVGQDSIHSGEDVSAELAERIQAQYPVPPFNLGPDASIGVSRNYGITYVSIGDTAHALVNALGEDVSGVSAVKLDVTTTAPGGGMLVLPNPRAQVNPSAFNSTFWLETWQDGRQQLQYIQSLLFRFTASFSDGCREEPPKDPECMIHWPHVLQSTLKKVKSYECPETLVKSGTCMLSTTLR